MCEIHVVETASIQATSNSNLPWGINQINAPAAWNLISNPSFVRVGVMDTGIWAGHPSLSGRLDTHMFRNFTNDGHNVLGDHDGHGTHVAGTIAGQGVGVAHQNIRLVSLRVLNTYIGSGNVLGQVAAITHATNLPENQRIHILNASLGGTNNHNGRMEAIRQFPGLFVAAAGNSSNNNDTNPFFPASHRLPNLISVGASDSSDRRSVWHSCGIGCMWGLLCNGPSGSNFGATTVCIFAPGTGVRSTVPTRVHSSGYVSWNGSSMAAPHVAGVAALMRSVNPDLDAATKRNIILGTADRNNSLDNISVSNGRVNAYRAVRKALTIGDGVWVNNRPLHPGLYTMQVEDNNTASIVLNIRDNNTRLKVQMHTASTVITFSLCGNGTSTSIVGGDGLLWSGFPANVDIRNFRIEISRLTLGIYDNRGNRTISGISIRSIRTVVVEVAQSSPQSTISGWLLDFDSTPPQRLVIANVIIDSVTFYLSGSIISMKILDLFES